MQQKMEYPEVIFSFLQTTHIVQIKLKQIRLAYKSEKIRNKRLVEKYLLNPRLTRNQMEEIRKALIQDVNNIEGIAHDEIPEELMRKLREIGLSHSEKERQFSANKRLQLTGIKAAYDIKSKIKGGGAAI